MSATSGGAHPVRRNLTLTITSLLSILLFSLHVADDIVRGFEPGTLTNATAVFIFTAWMVGTLALAGRRSGYVLSLLGSLMSAAVPFLHMRGKGVGGEFAESSGALFFIWTLLALGTTGLYSVILCVQGLWRLRRRREPRPDAE